MKRNVIFSGLALIAFAFTAAAFTAKQTSLANHYIQNPGSCDPIPVTNCNTTATNPCLVNDQQVFENQNPEDETKCITALKRP